MANDADFHRIWTLAQLHPKAVFGRDEFKTRYEKLVPCDQGVVSGALDDLWPDDMVVVIDEVQALLDHEIFPSYKDKRQLRPFLSPLLRALVFCPTILLVGTGLKVWVYVIYMYISCACIFMYMCMYMYM